MRRCVAVLRAAARGRPRLGLHAPLLVVVRGGGGGRLLGVGPSSLREGRLGLGALPLPAICPTGRWLGPVACVSWASEVWV